MHGPKAKRRQSEHEMLYSFKTLMVLLRGQGGTNQGSKNGVFIKWTATQEYTALSYFAKNKKNFLSCPSPFQRYLSLSRNQHNIEGDNGILGNKEWLIFANTLYTFYIIAVILATKKERFYIFLKVIISGKIQVRMSTTNNNLFKSIFYQHQLFKPAIRTTLFRSFLFIF